MIVSTSDDLCSLDGFFPLTSVGEAYVHNPLNMSSSTSYKAKTRESKSVKGTPTTCLAILGYRLLKTICIWSISDGLSTTSAIFSHQWEIKKEMDSSDLCLKASSSLLDTSTTILNENYRKNSWAKSSHVLHHKDSKYANQCWAAPLRDNGNKVIICDSSNPWALITVL